MRRAIMLAHLVAVAMLPIIGGASFAQDAIPETPPELRDFRLDPEREQPQPQPAPEQTVAVPPAVPTIEPPADQPTTRQQRAPDSARSNEPEASADVAKPAAETLTPPFVVPQPTAPELIDEQPPAEENRPTLQPSDGAAFNWQIAAGIALIVALTAGFLMWRRRRVQQRDNDRTVTALAEMTGPLAAPTPAKPAILPERSPMPPVAKAVLSAALPEAPKLTLAFTPDKATISFTSLTVKGRLQVSNASGQSATAIELRAGLMTASSTQARRIADFHRLSGTSKGEPLGDAKPGETIAVAIELAVPLSDMESFLVGEQKLLVPIVIANLTYHIDGEDNAATTEFACMIGREAMPPAAKMGPLRLDLGPRSFASLGQRPVHG